MKTLSLGETDTFITKARIKNNPSGIYLLAGATYSIKAEPLGQLWRDGWILDPFTANGREVSYLGLAKYILRVKNALWFSLCGYIVDSNEPAFKIGEMLHEFTPKQDGELITFANDVNGFYWHNNRGSITSVIKRIA